MRAKPLLIAAGLWLGFANAALAGPQVAHISITVGPALARQVDTVGPQEIERLTGDLHRTVERRLPVTADGGELILVIEDARPNRPTLTKMSRSPSLSYESFGVGGARISGEYVDAAGARTPVRYSWYETDISQASYAETWRDANTAFERFARRLSTGDATTQR